MLCALVAICCACGQSDHPNARREDAGAAAAGSSGALTGTEGDDEPGPDAAEYNEADSGAGGIGNSNNVDKAIAGEGGNAGIGGAGTEFTGQNSAAGGGSEPPSTSSSSTAGNTADSSSQASGKIWATRFCPTNVGTQYVDLSNRTVATVDAQVTDVYTVFHGKWFVYRSRATDDTTYRVIDTETWNVLHQNTLPELLTLLQPAPQDVRLLAGLRIVNQASLEWAVLDVESGTLRYKIPGGPHQLFAWLPDGSYLRTSSDGTRFVGQLDGQEEALPKLELPTGYTLSFQTFNSTVNPKGDQHLLQLYRGVNGSGSTDIWVASFDSSKLERITMTSTSTYAYWSPDGTKILYSVDPDFSETRCDWGYSWQRHSRITYFVVDAESRSSQSAIPAETFGDFSLGIGARVVGWTR